MSPSAYITTRVRKSGKRYVVRYRLGGRYTKLRHAGSFVRLRDAEARRDFVRSELAAGRDPAHALAALLVETTPETLRERFDAFIDSRVDVSEKTRALYRNARDRLGELADFDPTSIRPSHIQVWVALNTKADDNPDGLSPASLTMYLSTIRQVLDFCDVEPNPARSKKIRLPQKEIPEVEFPSNEDWVAIKVFVADRSKTILRLIEATGLRIAEALALTYGDVDFVEGRIRVSRVRTKRRTAGQRWLPVPSVLLDAIAALVPLEDRARDRKVFPNLTGGGVRADLERACRDAEIAAYHPHQLRHRRCSLWLAHGFETVFVKQWSGHSKASMLTDVYGHVVVDPVGDEWRDFWLGAYEGARQPKRVPTVKEEA